MYLYHVLSAIAHYGASDKQELGEIEKRATPEDLALLIQAGMGILKEMVKELDLPDPKIYKNEEFAKTALMGAVHRIAPNVVGFTQEELDAIAILEGLEKSKKVN